MKNFLANLTQKSNTYNEKVSFYSPSFQARIPQNVTKEIGEKSLKAASAAIAATGLASLAINASSGAGGPDNNEILLKVREEVKENLKKFISREKYIVSSENISKDIFNIDSYITHSIKYMITDYDKLTEFEIKYLEAIFKEIILERINDKSKPKDFSDIVLLSTAKKTAKYNEILSSKEIFTIFRNEKLSTQKIANLIKTTYLTALRRLHSYGMEADKERTKRIKESPKENAEIVALAEEGKSIKEIAELKDVSEQCVNSILKKNKQLTTSQKKVIARDEVTFEQFKALIDQGLSYEAIARELDLNLSQVMHLKKKFGLESQNALQQQKVNSPEFIEKVKELNEKGYSKSKIAKELGTSLCTISSIFTDNNLESKRQRSRKTKTPIDVQMVIDLFTKENLSISKIQTLVGRAYATIQKILANAGVYVDEQLQKEVNDPENRRIVLELYKEFPNIRQISEKSGIKQKVVSEILKKEGLLSKRQQKIKEHKSQEFINKVIYMATVEGKTPGTIASELNKHYNIISNILKENNIISNNQLKIKERNNKLAEQISELVSKNYNNDAIIQALQISEIQLYRIANKYNIPLKSSKEADYNSLSDKELQEILYNLYFDIEEQLGNCVITELIDFLYEKKEFNKDQHNILAEFTKLIDNTKIDELNHLDKLTQIQPLINWSDKEKHAKSNLDSIKEKYNAILKRLIENNNFALHSLCLMYTPKEEDDIENAEYIINTIKNSENLDQANQEITHWDTKKKNPNDFILKLAEKYAKDEHGNVNARIAGEYIINAQKFTMALNDIDDDSHKQYAEIVNKMLIANGIKRYSDAYKVLNIYEETPEIFRPVLLNYAKKWSEYNKNIFTDELLKLKEKIAFCDIEKDSAFEMYNSQNAYMGKVLILNEAKKECWDYCKGDFDKFYNFMKLFYDAATRTYQGKNGVEDLGSNNKKIQWLASIKITGGHGIGDMRFYASKEYMNSHNDKYKNFKFVFDKFGGHKYYKDRN